MKMSYVKSFVLIIGVILRFHFAHAQSIHEIDDLLSQAYEKDQKVRFELMNLTKRVNNAGTNNVSAAVADSLMMLSGQMQVIDIENQNLIASVLKDGLPEDLSPQSYKTIWLIVDHADLKQQKHYLPLMEKAASKGLISANNYAVLTDRIRMREGKPQKYGTQSYTVTSDGKQVTYIWPVENPEKLNELRKEIEAGSIEEYVQLLKTATGCEVIYDPELTVSQIKKEAY